MIFLLVPYFFIELYLSLKTGEMIGFAWSAIWIMASFMLGMALLKRSSFTMMSNMHNLNRGKFDIRRFQNASMSYFIAAVLLMIPGVFSDLLGLVALVYTLYLQFVAKITPESENIHFNTQGDDDVIDVEIIDEYSRSDRNT
jgi:UPF0716 family protein affecting phage T7 exclusion